MGTLDNSFFLVVHLEAQKDQNPMTEALGPSRLEMSHQHGVVCQNLRDGQVAQILLATTLDR